MVAGDLDRVEDEDLHRRQDTSEVAADAPQPGLVEQPLDAIRGDAHGDVHERGLPDAHAGELARDASERRGLSASIAAAGEDSVAVGGDHAIADEIALTTRLVAERHDLRRPLRTDQATDLHLHLLHRGAQRLVDEPGQGRVAGEAVPDAVFHRRQRRLGVLEPGDGVRQVLCEGLYRRDRVGTSASRGRRRRQYPLEQTAKRQMRLACLDVGGREVVGRERRLDARDAPAGGCAWRACSPPPRSRVGRAARRSVAISRRRTGRSRRWRRDDRRRRATGRGWSWPSARWRRTPWDSPRRAACRVVVRTPKARPTATRGRESLRMRGAMAVRPFVGDGLHAVVLPSTPGWRGRMRSSPRRADAMASEDAPIHPSGW